MTTTIDRTDTPDYRRWYQRGWRYSTTSPVATLEHGDNNHYPDAWYDGYLDAAAGRAKWHLLHCTGCDEHDAADMAAAKGSTP